MRPPEKDDDREDPSADGARPEDDAKSEEAKSEEAKRSESEESGSPEAPPAGERPEESLAGEEPKDTPEESAIGEEPRETPGEPLVGEELPETQAEEPATTETPGPEPLPGEPAEPLGAVTAEEANRRADEEAEIARAEPSAASPEDARAEPVGGIGEDTRDEPVGGIGEDARDEPVGGIGEDARAGEASAPPGEPMIDPFSPPPGPETREGAAAAAAASTPQPAADPAPQPAPASGGSGGGGGFFSLVFGGLIAGLIGAGAVWYLLQQQGGAEDVFSASIGEQGARIDEQGQRLGALEDEIAALDEALSAEDPTAALEELRTETVDLFDELAATLSSLTGRLDSIEARLAENVDRIASLEARPIADPTTAQQVLQSEIEEMRQQVGQAAQEVRAQVDDMRGELSGVTEEVRAQVRAQVDDMRSELARAAEEAQTEIDAAETRARELEQQAVAEAQAVRARGALAQVRAALDSGAPYPGPLQELQSTTENEVPQALVAPAETGVPTLADLLAGYPDAARDALRETAVVETEGDPAQRVLAFLRTQTQARSLSPREGEEPDAILSRAEAALGEGDVNAALSELQALPEGGLAAMGDWLERARTRAEATAAADAVAETLN